MIYTMIDFKYRIQHDSFKKETENSLDFQSKMKKNYEDQINNLLTKEKVVVYYIYLADALKALKIRRNTNAKFSFHRTKMF